MKQIIYIGKDKTGPENMVDCPFEKDSQIWHIYVDFACMPERPFTLKECFEYHGLDKSFGSQYPGPEHYYGDAYLKTLEDMGFIKILENV